MAHEAYHLLIARHERIPLVFPQSKQQLIALLGKPARPPAPPNPLSVRHFPILLTFPPPFLDALPLPPPLPNPSHTHHHHHHHDHVCFCLTATPINNNHTTPNSVDNLPCCQPIKSRTPSVSPRSETPVPIPKHQKQKKLVASHGEWYGE